MNNLKDTVTNIVATIVGVGTLVSTVLRKIPSDAKWYVWAGASAIVIISYFTGKGQDGKKIDLNSEL